MNGPNVFCMSMEHHVTISNRGANLSQGQTDFNYEMSNVQHCVWWRIGDLYECNCAFLYFMW